MKNKFEAITYKASKTFHTTSLLFPKEVRNDVFILYSFLRTADDLIDSLPPQFEAFNNFKQMTLDMISGKKSNNEIIQTFGKLMKRKKIDQQLISSFFSSLELDFRSKQYETFEDLKKFTYGVSEVVGLLMAQVMELPKESHITARKLGLGMQLINILRDVEEDRLLGRVYIPQNELRNFHLPNQLTFSHVKNKQKEFTALIHFQLERIVEILDEGRKGFKYLPKNFILPISSAADLYYQTADKIKKDPFIIFEKKVKPNKLEISFVIFKNLFKTYV